MEVIVESNELNEADQIRERVLSLVQDISYAVEGIGYAVYLVQNSPNKEEIQEAVSYYNGFDVVYHKAMQLLDNLKEHAAFDELQYVFEVEHKLKEHIAVYNEANNDLPMLLKIHLLTLQNRVSNMTDAQYNEEQKYLPLMFDGVFHDAMDMAFSNNDIPEVV